LFHTHHQAKERSVELTWKLNWVETQQHFRDWWQRDGLVVGTWPPPLGQQPHATVEMPPGADSPDRFYRDAGYHATREHYRLANAYLGGDILALAETDIGPGSLALYLGSEAGIAEDTVWFMPWMASIDQPLAFDAANVWWRITAATLEACLERAGDRYLVGCPDLVENLDILAAGRGPETVMMDLVENPGVVLERLGEINRAWCEVYTRIYNMIRLPDGSSVFGAFRLWGPGKTAKVQCDASAMISPRMFRRFVQPFLAEQCAWLDQAMYHLDGHQCLCHLDALLEIDNLDAIEWTPDPSVPSGGDPAWYELYRSILKGGKSVQAVGIQPAEVKPLLDAVGPKGMYLLVDVASQAEFESLWAISETFR
jgi:hypothetical protein